MRYEGCIRDWEEVLDLVVLDLLVDVYEDVFGRYYADVFVKRRSKLVFGRHRCS